MKNPSFEDIKKLPHGTKIEVTISSLEAKRIKGAISIDEGGIFICTNSINGMRAKDKLGYKYSWVVQSINAYLISELIVLTEELYPIF